MKERARLIFIDEYHARKNRRDTNKKNVIISTVVFTVTLFTVYILLKMWGA